MAKKKKVINLFVLKCEAMDAHESFMEGLHNELFPEDDWQFIHDHTKGTDLPLLLADNYSPITQLLARHRLAGKSVWDSGLFPTLEKMIMDGDVGRNLNFDFDQGRFRVLAHLFETLGSRKWTKIMKEWARFNPYR